jgi:hypothetical protein
VREDDRIESIVEIINEKGLDVTLDKLHYQCSPLAELSSEFNSIKEAGIQHEDTVYKLSQSAASTPIMLSSGNSKLSNGSFNLMSE